MKSLCLLLISDYFQCQREEGMKAFDLYREIRLQNNEHQSRIVILSIEQGKFAFVQATKSKKLKSIEE